MSMSESIALYKTANIKWAVPSQPTPIKVIGIWKLETHYDAKSRKPR